MYIKSVKKDLDLNKIPAKNNHILDNRPLNRSNMSFKK